ncbi:MAG TPA: hypothetical protein VGC34_12450 [Steroidobacteraceae bacterium]
MASGGNRPTGQSHTRRDGGGMCIDLLRLEVRQFRSTKGFHVTH